MRVLLDERNEQEIEARLRAALMARTEQVSHANLRPGVPPNAHTAGLGKSASRWAWVTDWRKLLVPVAVAAALAGGVFVGAALPGGGGHGAAASAAAGGGSTSGPAPTTSASASAPAVAAGPSFGGLTFQTADWTLTPVDATSACLAPKGHAAPVAGATLPCGVDALWIKTGVAADSWPLSTAAKKAGWWPGTASAVTSIPCPGAAAAGGVDVATSALLRSSDKYALAGTTTARYQEWTVTCSDGSGAVPRLWEVGTPPVALTAVSVDPGDDAALLAVVASAQSAQSAQ